MATLCQKMAPYSHVLDVINVGLDFSHKALHLLLWNNRNAEKNIFLWIWKPSKVVVWRIKLESYYLALSVEKWQRKESDHTWRRKKEENVEYLMWQPYSVLYRCIIDSIFPAGDICFLLIMSRVRPLHRSPRYVTRYIRTRSWDQEKDRNSSRTSTPINKRTLQHCCAFNFIPLLSKSIILQYCIIIIIMTRFGNNWEWDSQ